MDWKHNKQLIIFFLLVLSACSANSADGIENPEPTPDGFNLAIPEGSPVVIDGTITNGEWEDALTVEMSGGGLLFLKYSADSLYLAIDAEKEGVVNVGILREADLHILHSSAALGSAIYRWTDSGWEMVKNFEWCCRVSAPDSQFEKLWADEGWLSHNQYYGDTTQTEYQIRIPPENIHLAVTYLYRDHSGSAWWPGDLEQDDLLQFSSPPSVGDIAIFSEEGWATLQISD